MAKTQNIRMGANLEFVEKIILVGGIVTENMHVLYRAPIPVKQYLVKNAEAANALDLHRHNGRSTLK